MMWKTILLSVALALSAPVHAQSKKELVNKLLKLQQPGIEVAARAMAEQPAALMLQRALVVVRARVPEDKREAVAKDIQAEARKYAEDVGPTMREAAVKLAPSTIGPILEEKFSEAELKQLIAALESPVYRKYQGLGGDMQKALGEKLAAEKRADLEPKLKGLEQAIGQRISAAIPAAAGASAPKK
jgi:hypothetical protein